MHASRPKRRPSRASVRRDVPSGTVGDGPRTIRDGSPVGPLGCRDVVVAVACRTKIERDVPGRRVIEPSPERKPRGGERREGSRARRRPGEGSPEGTRRSCVRRPARWTRAPARGTAGNDGERRPSNPFYVDTGCFVYKCVYIYIYIFKGLTKLACPNKGRSKGAITQRRKVVGETLAGKRVAARESARRPPKARPLHTIGHDFLSSAQ